MHIVGIENVGRNFSYKWPNNYNEPYKHFIEYKVKTHGKIHNVKIGFGKRDVYGEERIRIVVWIDGHPEAEFFGADDFDKTGEVLSEIKVSSGGRGICRYSEGLVPERYSMFNVIGLPLRVDADGVRDTWSVVANIADHKTMIALAFLRKYEKGR